MLLKRCPGNEGAVEIRGKKRAHQDDVMSNETDNSEPNSSGVQDNGAESPFFLPQKEALYQHRFEEGCDLYDTDYISWLHVNQTDALPDESTIIQFFSDAPVITPLDSDILDNAHSLESIGCQPSNSDLSPAPSTSSGSGSSVLAPETPLNDESGPSTVPCIPVVLDSSSGTSGPTTALKRSPLASITNLLPGRIPKSSGTFVSKHLDQLQHQNQPKLVKPGS